MSRFMEKIMNTVKYFLLAAVCFCTAAGFCAEPVFETTFQQDEKGNILDNKNNSFKGKLHKGASIADAPSGKALTVERILDNLKEILSSALLPSLRS